MRKKSEAGVTTLRNFLRTGLLFCLLTCGATEIGAQCQGLSGTVSNVGDEEGVSNVLVKAFGADGELKGQAMTDFFGNYELTGLSNGEPFRIEFVSGGSYKPAGHSASNGTSVQFATAPNCDVDYLVVDPEAYCAENAQVALTCFVQGGIGENDNIETLVFTDYDFSLDSEVQKYAMKSQTGSIWGLTWKSATNELFSSAFIKQYAGLSEHGHSAIFSTNTTTGITKLHARLDELGQDVGTITTDPDVPEYGAQVGMTGLGGLEMSADEETLYVINIYNNTLVSLSTSNPTAETTRAFEIPNPGCQGGDLYKAFAITRSGDKLYVGVTCTAFQLKENSEVSATVFEFDLASEEFTEIFTTDYPIGFWRNTPANSRKTQHWLTDLAITDEGNMILSLSDRIAHRYHDVVTQGRLDDQHPDILLAYNDNGVWKLENNGQAGSLTGSHPNQPSGEGPGGGEFFGYDYWISGPEYHSEIATGSVMVLPGDNSVVATVFDPDFDSYTGGLHKYSTINGDKLGVGIIYEHTNNPQFGKASGLGDMVTICGDLPLEIGNLLWIDANNNGVQDAGEPHLPNIDLKLYNKDCVEVGFTTTDENGNYYFNGTNVDLNGDGIFDGLSGNSDFYVVVTDEDFDMTSGILTTSNGSFTLTKVDVGFGTNADVNDSDAQIAGDECNLFSGKPAIKVRTGGTGNSDHTFDIGFSPAGDFDLALKKELVSDFAVKYGDTATFKITVYNQGGVTAAEVVINDYIAEGYTFLDDVNVGWKLDDSIAQTLLDAPLTPGTQQELFIKLKINEGASVDQLVNYAEIGAAFDKEGEPIKDVDSTPDNIVDNDNGGVVFTATDNEINDDGTIDEDDHDPATVGIFDLALRKQLANPGEQVLANSRVSFVITVFNQGSISATSLKVSDYLPSDLIFNPDINDGWELVNDSTIVYTSNEELAPLSNLKIDLTLEIGNIVAGKDVINYAEISEAIDEYGNTDSDVDSHADDDRSNDIGGSPYDSTDDEINDNGDLDEDDHDPALLNFSLFDLALIKTTISTSVKAGQNVDFLITVINQGEIAAKRIGLVDYIPEGLTLNDPTWSMYGEDMAKREIFLEAGLQPGDSTSVIITLKVDDDYLAGTLINVAEIDHVTGMDDKDLSNSDVDSSPDDQRTNDPGGLPFGPTDNEVNGERGVDEDDHDPAYVYVFAALVSEACICLENATTDDEGQFGELIEIIAPSGLTWYIADVDGLFEADIMNMGAPTGSDYPKGVQYPMTEFVTGPNGYILEEYPIGDSGNSEYYIVAMRQDGESYEVVIRNDVGAQEIITGAPCNYLTNTFEAAEGVCIGSLVTYCVDDFAAGGANMWTIQNGDAVIVGDADGECVDVQYGTTVGSEVDIVFTSGSPEACYSPAMQTVTIGESAGFLSCRGNINVSLNDECEVGLTPEAILTTPVTPTAVYSIIYTTPEGFMLGEDVEWNNYVNREIVAKVMDNCSGNSCWSFIKLEDKRAPEIECLDLTVSCIEMMDYNGPFVLDNCSRDDVIISATGQTREQFDCDDEFSFELTRSFKARDQNGNVSDECTQTISVLRPDLDAIVGPEDRTMESGMALTCDYLDTIAGGGVLDPAIFGVPTLEGVPIYPASGEFCNLGVTFKDNIFPGTGCVTKIMRTWLIFEWHCDNTEADTIIQFFNIADMEDPSITCLGDINVSSSGSACEGIVNLPAAVVSDDCTENPRVDITYPGGFLENSNGGTIALPLGVHEVTYTVTDDCFNSTSCTILVTVEDRTPPIAICEQHTVLSVRTDGTTYALATTFDDGSYDECAFGGIEVRRMDGGEACGMDDEGLFSDRVEFCCADVGEEVMVVLRVFDAALNENQCMVSVQIQDKNPPSIVAPEDVTVDCLEVLDLDDLSRFGDAVAFDNCENTVITEDVFSGLNECRTGIIQRRFTATDGNGSATDFQIITVITEDTFDLDNIVWPLDYTTSAQCDAGSLLPDNLPEANGYPQILDEGFCNQVGITYSDKVFDILNSETTCQKIIRTWIVEDFCQPLDEGGFARWRYDQVIEISNNTPPVITSSCDDVTVCSFDEDCMTGPITLTAGASDDCTPGDMMRYQYFIDFDDDGIVDIEDRGEGDSITIMGEYPLGAHSVLYRFSDICGNTVTCRQNFTIENCTKPVIVCHDGLSVGLVPMDTDGDGEVDDEMAIVKARTFNASSYHPCGDDIIYSFTENPADSCRTYDCDSIGLRTVTIYGITSTGVTGFCVTDIDVQDNNDVDLCRSVEDCIVMPTDITITECTDDFSPETIGGGPMIDPDCICTNTTIEFEDRDSTDLTNTCTTIIRDWTVTFNCGGAPMVFTSTSVITIFDSRPPIVDCPPSVTVNSSADECNGDVVLGIPSVLSDCTTEFTITNDSEFADSNIGAASGNYPVGLDTVIYTITDKCGNASTCEITVLVTDNADPICDVNDITINITDTMSDVTVDPGLIDNGSFDECGLVVDRVLNPAVFGCEDAGTVQDVTLTITDDSGNMTDCFAQITVRDSVAPVCVTRTTNVNLFDDAMVTIPESLIDNGSFDLCGQLVDLEILNNGFNCERLGMQTVILRITDDSGNFTDCEQEINVVDRGAPDCILMDITIQLDGNDQATITGDDLDNGSFDMCSGLDTLILERTMFTCDDIGNNPVDVMAVDSAGNSSNCIAIVTVESSGQLMCIADDVTVYLGENGQAMIDVEDVDGGSGIPCADDAVKSIDRNMFFCNDVGILNPVVLTITSSLGDTSCTAMVMVLDTLPPVVNCPVDMTISCVDISDDLTVYGNVSTVGSNCSVLAENVMDTVVFDLGLCGLGTITRTFVATDINGNSSSCSQVITVNSGTSFTEDNITWPDDTLTLMQCISVDPDTIGSRPMVSIPDSMCTNLGITFDDEQLTNNENCLDTILRTWMVVDSCPTPFNVFTFEQLLIISDEMAPMITLEDTLFLCDTLVSYSFTVADCNDVTVSYSTDSLNGTGTTIMGDFEEGNTTVNVTATDRCGNVSEDSIVVNIVLDTVPPSIVCINRPIIIEDDGETVVLPSDGEWFFRVSDNTTDSMDLMYSFNPEFDMSTDTLRFICDSVIIKSHVLDIYVKDKGGNVSTCEVSYVTSDPNDVCPDNPAAIQGMVMTEAKLEIPDVRIDLVNADVYEMTNQSGFYNFPAMVSEKVYELRPEKNTDRLAGVTSLDLVLIQRHILGTQKLSSAYQVIAADINKSGKVTGKDLIDLRKNILGLLDVFPNNKSWRFVDADYSFIDASNPFNEVFPESYMIYDINGPIYKDFVGLKVGDVNGSIELKSRGTLVARSAPLALKVDSRWLEAGTKMDMPLIMNEDLDIAGGQLSFIIDGAVDVKGVSSDVLEVNASNYSIRPMGKSQLLTLVLLPEQAKEVESGVELLTISLEAKNGVMIADAIELNQSFKNELYSADLDIRDVSLRFNELEVEEFSDVLLQNTPNPWKEKTIISFDLRKDEKATINVYTVTGALVTSITGDYVKGRNEVTLKAASFNQNGVFYYELVTESSKLSKRMILLK